MCIILRQSLEYIPNTFGKKQYHNEYPARVFAISKSTRGIRNVIEPYIIMNMHGFDLDTVIMMINLKYQSPALKYIHTFGIPIANEYIDDYVKSINEFLKNKRIEVFTFCTNNNDCADFADFDKIIFASSNHIKKLKLMKKPIDYWNWNCSCGGELNLSRFCNLKDLTCVKIEITDEFLQTLPISLENLTLSSIDVNTEDVIGDFKHLINLKSLNLCGVKPIISNLLIHFLKLSDVTIDKCFVDELPISVITFVIINGCYNGIDIFDLSHLDNLMEISTRNTSMSMIKRIILPDNIITIDHSFSYLHCIEEINFSNLTKIKKINGNVFECLPELTMLDLSGLTYEHLDINSEYFLENCEKLKSIKLSKKVPKHLDDLIKRNLKNQEIAYEYV